MSNTTKPSNNENMDNERLTSAEMGKLWVIYMGNSMSEIILKYYLHHVDDQDIKAVIQEAHEMSITFQQGIRDIFAKENIPIPSGFNEEDDLNLNAPRLFADEFYLYYLRYTAKAGLSIYSTAIPLMTRKDVSEFVINCDKSTIALFIKLKQTMKKKGLLTKPPYIPVPEKNDYVKKQSYLNGFLGEVRTLHALEIAHLHDNIENNITSKALLIGFSQVAQKKEVRDFFQRGRELTMKHIETCTQQLHKENLPSEPLLDDLVETSKIAPYSDRIMLSHKIDMFSMKIRTYANATSLNGRRDIGAMYAKFIIDVGHYVEDATNIMIKEGWMEQPPKAANRSRLASD